MCIRDRQYVDQFKVLGQFADKGRLLYHGNQKTECHGQDRTHEQSITVNHQIDL